MNKPLYGTCLLIVSAFLLAGCASHAPKKMKNVIYNPIAEAPDDPTFSVLTTGSNDSTAFGRKFRIYIESVLLDAGLRVMTPRAPGEADATAPPAEDASGAASATDQTGAPETAERSFDGKGVESDFVIILDYQGTNLVNSTMKIVFTRTGEIGAVVFFSSYETARERLTEALEELQVL